MPFLYSVSWPHRVRMPQDQWEPRFDLVELGSMAFKGRTTTSTHVLA